MGIELTSNEFAIAFLAGIIPALFWLWFWLREDKVRPEPRTLIASAFVAGMLVVPVVLPLQHFAIERFSGCSAALDTFLVFFGREAKDCDLILVWVMIEEIIKYSAALIVVLWNKAVDEPIDTIIYMISIALGFSALENALFIANPLSDGDYLNSFITGNFRFLGATLLHVLASGTVGVFMALAFYKRDIIKITWATVGLFVAIVLHALFNFFIMGSSGGTILSVFMFVWMGIIMLFLIFEKVKIIEKNHRKRL